jgi:BNR repeat-like domain
MQRHWSLYLLALALLPGLLARPAISQQARPLVELSRPNAVGDCDTGFKAFGTWPIEEAQEPVVAVNPIHPDNIVTAWIQGPFQDIIAAVSLDGGQNWQQVPIPLTVCSGGSFAGTGDPWLSFAPNGDLYVVAGAGHTPSDFEIVVIKSSDGGLHWSAPLVVPESFTEDAHPSLTADPKDARFVYAIWDNGGPAVFSRTTDSGLTWKPARPIVPKAPQSFVQFSQILVLPNGTLVDIYDFRKLQPDKPVITLQVRRSSNHGQTWSAPRNAVTMTPLDRADGSPVVDPKTGQFVSDVTNASFAVDGHNGNLYAVWEDGRFSNFQYNDTAFAMSADGGLKWSAPIRVNQTPLNIPPTNRQAFFPSIAVAADGTIGVSYYDFRFNDPNPGLPTDRWLVLCHPSSASPATNPANWGREVRLTESSLNMEAVVAKVFKDRFFIGDYFGLATVGNDFVSVYIQPDHDNVTSTFFRSVMP